MTIEFVVPGRPVPMARPRVTARGTYTPKRCVDYKRLVWAIARKEMNGIEPLNGALSCHISLGFAVPQSYPKQLKADAYANRIRPINRNSGDVDNHAKAIMDALTGIVWNDDSQVVNLTVSKWFGDDCAEVTVSECGEVDYE